MMNGGTSRSVWVVRLTYFVMFQTTFYSMFHVFFTYRKRLCIGVCPHMCKLCEWVHVCLCVWQFCLDVMPSGPSNLSVFFCGGCREVSSRSTSAHIGLLPWALWLWVFRETDGLWAVGRLKINSVVVWDWQGAVWEWQAAFPNCPREKVEQVHAFTEYSILVDTVCPLETHVDRISEVLSLKIVLFYTFFLTSVDVSLCFTSFWQGGTIRL